MYNKIILIGNLTFDPELKILENNKVTNFSLAVNRQYNKEKVDFFRIIAWNKLAEIVSSHLVKGALVQVEGSMYYRTYADTDGVLHDIWEVTANNITFLKEGKQ